MRGSRAPHTLLVGRYNDAATLENSLGVTILPGNSTLKYITKRKENLCLHKKACM